MSLETKIFERYTPDLKKVKKFGFQKNKEEYIKYLYTLCTRAEKAIILVGD